MQQPSGQEAKTRNMDEEHMLEKQVKIRAREKETEDGGGGETQAHVKRAEEQSSAHLHEQGIVAGKNGVLKTIASLEKELLSICSCSVCASLSGMGWLRSVGSIKL